MRPFLEKSVMRQRWSLLLLNLITLTAVVLSTHYSTQQLLKMLQEEAKTQETLAELQTVLSLITDAETGRRGYLLTGESSFLAPYTAARTSLDPSLQSLADHLDRDPEQQARLAQLNALIRERLDALELSIAVYRTGANQAIQRDFLQEGKQIHDRLRQVIGEMTGYEQQQLRQVMTDSDSLADRINWILLGGFGLNLVTFLVTYGLLNRQILARRGAEGELQRMNRALKTLSACNQLLVRAANEPEFLDQICQAIASVGGYPLAWIGLPTPEAPFFRAIARAGAETAPWESLVIPGAEASMPESPALTVLRTGQSALVPASEKTGEEAASITLPLSFDGDRGILQIYHAPGKVFSASEIQLLEELAGDVAYGVEMLRIRRAREQAEESLRQAKSNLELRIQERTAALTVTNHRLEQELQERKRVEEALRQSESRFRSAFDDAAVGMAIVDLNGFWVKVNSKVQAILGYSSEELLTTTFAALTYPEDLEMSLQNMHDLLAGKIETVEVEKRYFHKQGHIVWVLLSVSLVRDCAGQPLHFVAQLQDITERRAVEQMKSEFISVVSHELRTPLTAIHGSISLLVSGVLDRKPEKAQRMLQIAATDTERLVRLVNDILDLERLESSTVVLEREWCDAAGLIAQSIEAVQAIADKAGIRLTLQAGALQIWASPDRIIQTLTNLLSNAIKFSSPGSSIELGVEQTYRDGLECAQFFVRDHGRGIPADKLESIFGRFQQVDVSDSRRRGGTGLGLAISRSIVTQHSGHIWAESTLGEGSTFYFTIPIPLSPERALSSSEG